MSNDFQDTSNENENLNFMMNGCLDCGVNDKMDELDCCRSSCYMTITGTSPKEEHNEKGKSCKIAAIEKRNCILNATDASFYRTENEKRRNENKIRIKYIPAITNENTKVLVLTLINLKLNVRLKNFHISHCKRVKGWEGIFEPMDIVVTFSSKEMRDVVYDNKGLIEDVEESMVMICDELGSERVEIWRRATLIFGDSRVYTHCGAVVIIAWNNIHYRILTLHQFQRFMKREYSQKCNSEFLYPPNRIPNCEEIFDCVEPKAEKKAVLHKYQRKL